MIEGFNEGWIEFERGVEGSVKGKTSLKTILEEMVRDARKQAASAWEFFYKEKNHEDTTNDEVHSWRRDRCGSHLLLRFVERTSEGEEDE